MKRFVVACTLLLMATVASPAVAPAAEPPNPAIEAVVTRQLDAFRRNDAVAAFAMASPTIQGLFGDAQTFISMVERGFRPIWRSSRHRFVSLEIADGRLIQRVLIDGADGMTVVARYEMIEIGGQWRINSCTLEKGESA